MLLPRSHSVQVCAHWELCGKIHIDLQSHDQGTLIIDDSSSCFIYVFLRNAQVTILWSNEMSGLFQMSWYWPIKLEIYQVLPPSNFKVNFRLF